LSPRDELPLRARLTWWLMVQTERASGWFRRTTIEIWKGAMARRQKRRERRKTPVKKWEAWYLGDDGTCGNCGVANDNAGQFGECPTCGYEGKEISIG
jgi:hypothetical protein